MFNAILRGFLAQVKSSLPVIASVGLLLFSVLALAQNGDKQEERIKAVRQMYAKLPPIVLGLAEPVEITYHPGSNDNHPNDGPEKVGGVE